MFQALQIRRIEAINHIVRYQGALEILQQGKTERKQQEAATRAAIITAQHCSKKARKESLLVVQSKTGIQ
jgi:hypothetical protein